jgi:H+/Cl- antiporter ClcA
MRSRWHKVTEESVLLLSVFKWVILATVIGCVVGSVIALFLKILSVSLAVSTGFSHYYVTLPLALFTSTLLIYYLSPDSEGHGTEKVISAVHHRSGDIRLRVIPIKLMATIITLVSGGSAGKEGPCAQIGAAFSSCIAKLFRFSKEDRKKLVICGISAGFSAVFGTPVAGAIFGVEVLFVGSLMYGVLLPSFVAGMVSYQVASVLGIPYDYVAINWIPTFSPKLFMLIIVIGCLFGLISILFIETINIGQLISKKIKIWPPLRGLIGGILLVLIGHFISTEYLGLGLDTIDKALHGHHVIWYAAIIKMIATSITLGFGGSGGILTPIFFVGVTAGSVLGSLLGLPVDTMAAIGLVSLLAGAANTPLAACILAIELFGPEIASYATISCVLSFLITGYRSVFPSQVLAFSKSSIIKIKIGQEVEQTETHMDYKTRKVFGRGRHIVKQQFRRFWRKK